MYAWAYTIHMESTELKQSINFCVGFVKVKQIIQFTRDFHNLSFPYSTIASYFFRYMLFFRVFCLFVRLNAFECQRAEHLLYLAVFLIVHCNCDDVCRNYNIRWKIVEMSNNKTFKSVVLTQQKWKAIKWPNYCKW